MKLEKSVERQTKNTIEYYKNLDNLEGVPIDILRIMYKDLLKVLEITQQNYEIAIKQNITYKKNIHSLKENSIPKKKIEEIFNIKIYNMKFLSDTDWTEHQKEVDLEIANILNNIKQELLEDK